MPFVIWKKGKSNYEGFINEYEYAVHAVIALVFKSREKIKVASAKRKIFTMCFGVIFLRFFVISDLTVQI